MFHVCTDQMSNRRVAGAAYPLDMENRRYFHLSSRAQWDRVPGRPTAWRLHPYSYMWVPSSELFPAVGHSHTGSFPREFTLLVTLRLHPQVRSACAHFDVQRSHSVFSLRCQPHFYQHGLCLSGEIKFCECARQTVNVTGKLHKKRTCGL